MSNDLEKYLESIDLDRFEEILPIRRSIIEAAPSNIPPYEYNANRVAASLHPKKQFAVIRAVNDLNGAKCYTLSPDKACGTEHFSYFRAGQYVSVRLNIGEISLTRAFSLSSSPKEALKDSYCLTVKRTDKGFASNYIYDNWTIGTKIEMSAPEGEMYYEPLRDSQNVVAIAGGSGITPFLSLAKAIADGTENCSLVILYGSRTEGEILHRHQLDELSSNCDKIKVIYILSEEEKEGYVHGLIRSDLIQKYVPDIDYSVFLCGPRAMYEFVDKELSVLGVKKRRIRHEVFGDYKDADQDDEFPKQAIGKSFQLTVEFTGDEDRVIPAKSGESILTAMERAGIAAPSRCRSGECGFCRSRLASGSVYIPECVDKRRCADLADGFIHPCCTFPTSDCTICLNSERGEQKLKVKDMKKKAFAMNIIMATLISTVMGVLSAYLIRKGMPADQLARRPVVGMYIVNILESITVGIIVALVIPFGKWGKALTVKFKANPPSIKFLLLNCLPIAVGNATLVSLIVCLMNIIPAYSQIPSDVAPPFVVMWLGQWIKMLPIPLTVSYVFAVIISPFIVQLIGMPIGGPARGRRSNSIKHN